MKMGNNRKSGRAFFLLAVFSLTVFLLVGCLQPEIDYSGTAAPVLAIKNAPEGIDSLTVTVTADDMADLEFTYSPPPASIALEVPAGPARKFDVVVEVDNASPAKKYAGSSTVDLVAGETSSVAVAMALNEAKILIPDAGNHRIVQIDDMQGTNWTELTGGKLDFGSGDFLPYDIDLDDNSRIYIAYIMDQGNDGGLLRIDNISGAGRIPIVSDARVYAVAVDDTHNYIYYIMAGVGGYVLGRNELESLGSQEIFFLEGKEETDGFEIQERSTEVDGRDHISSSNESRGLDVGPDGSVYISSSDRGEIYKFNPNASQRYRIEATYKASSLVCRDVVVKAPYIYIIDSCVKFGGGPKAQITRLDFDLGNAVSYGKYIYMPPPTPSGCFWYPQRFVADLNSKIYLIDEEYYRDGKNYDYENIVSYDRIVSFDDINGGGWQVYGTEGDGIGRFKFYFYDFSS